MGIVLRTERKEDYEEVIKLTDLAFKDMPFSSHNEGELVRKLRKGINFIEDLSIVAVLGDKIIGHILFTTINIVEGEKIFKSLILAPVSVVPEYQRKGIGSQLIREGLERAKKSGYTSVIVVGHPEYYPKFGFEPAAKYNLKSSIEVPTEVFMVQELVENGLKDVTGTVTYPEEFI
jgi:predicted N-acetyltransferase YhbS